MPFILATSTGIGDAQPVLNALQSSITASSIMGVVGVVVGVTVVIGFAWWAARFATRKLMAALRKGKVTV